MRCMLYVCIKNFFIESPFYFLVFYNKSKNMLGYRKAPAALNAIKHILDRIDIVNNDNLTIKVKGK